MGGKPLGGSCDVQAGDAMKRGVSIIEMTGCKWPVSDDLSLPGGKVFCNAPMHDHRYCKAHARESAAVYSEKLIRHTTKQALQVKV